MTVYLDMDGVIADFFGGIEQLHDVDHWKSIKDKQDLINSIRYTDFFYQLKPFETSWRLVERVKNKSEGDWGICSSPLEQDTNNSAYWKRRWLEDKGYMPDDLEKCIFTGNKHKYAISRLTGKPNILIDDKLDNILRWNNAGGIGIRFQCNEDDVEYLVHELKKVLKRLN